MERFNSLPEYLVAKKICLKLIENGYESYLAGGCVRDYLLDRIPSDFDVATAARPDQVQALFTNNKDIGKKFGTILVIENDISVEVTSFRSDGIYIDGRHPQNIVFSSAKEDALRRDFTINALFWDPQKQHIIDYVGGLQDIESKVIRTVGTATDRFEEDHLRILRGIRFRAQIGFEIEASTKQAISKLWSSVFSVSKERFTNEIKKLLSGQFAESALKDMANLGLLPKEFSLISNKLYIKEVFCVFLLHFNSRDFFNHIILSKSELQKTQNILDFIENFNSLPSWHIGVLIDKLLDPAYFLVFESLIVLNGTKFDFYESLIQRLQDLEFKKPIPIVLAKDVIKFSPDLPKSQVSHIAKLAYYDQLRGDKLDKESLLKKHIK